MRGLSHEEVKQVFTRGSGTRSTDGAGSPRRVPLSLWAAIESIAPKIGCVPQTLNEWVKRVQCDAGLHGGVTTSDAQRVKELEREVKELRRANEILKLASAFFASTEPGRRLKS